MTQATFKIKFINDKFYIENNGLIIDKFCPICNRIITEANGKCECGHSLISPLKKQLYSICCSISIVAFCLLLIGFVVFDFTVIRKVNMYTVSPANVVVMTSLKNTQYKDYIQNIYVNPNKENELVIFVKPSYWNILSPAEKQEILTIAQNDWNKICKENKTPTKLKPLAYFANKE